MNFGLIAAVFIYLAVIAWLGYKGYGKTRTAGDYMLAGRDAHPYVMALSYGATFISTSAIVGFGGTASLFGMSLLWLSFLNIFVGIFIAFAVFGRRTRRIGLNLDAHTFPELIGRRLNSRFIQVFTALIIFVFMPLYAAAVLIGASRIIEVLLNVPFEISVVVFSILVGAYVILGGLKSVMYTDALQGTLMFLGMFTLLIVTYVKLGGVVEAHRSLGALSSLIPDSMTGGGITSWTASPAAGSPMWWVIYSSLVLGVGIGALAQPQLAVRFMTVKSDRELNRSIAVGGVFILVCVATVYVVGPLTNVYFHGTVGKIAIAVAEGNTDRVIPMYLEAAMPAWFSILFILVILSAAMSTLSSQFHAIGTAISRDIIEQGILKGKKAEGSSAILISRVGVLVSLLLTVLLSMKMGGGVIARATAIFFGLMASCFLAPYTAAMFWKRLTRKGAIAGIISGFTASIFCFLFLHGKEAAVFGVSQALFGRETLLGGLWPFVDPMVIAFPVSILFTVFVSLATRPENSELTSRAFRGIC
jgi:SSS family solute:Na+ symporter